MSNNVSPPTGVSTEPSVYNGTTWDRLRGSLAGVTAGVVAAWTGFTQVLGFARYLATRPTLADGQGSHLQSNTRGDLATQEQYLPDYEDNANDVAWTGNRALAVSTGAWSNYNSGNALIGTAGLTIKASAGRIRGIGGVNTSGATAYYLLVFNKASPPLINENAPVAVIPLDKTTSWSGSSGTIDFGPEGLYCPLGVSFAISTQPNTIAAFGTASMYVWALYL
jgi:hypothetical protein